MRSPSGSAPPRAGFQSEGATSLNPRLIELLVTAITFMLCFGLSSKVEAESKLLLEMPESLKDIVATTFDAQGRAIGRSWFEIKRDESGRHHIRIELSVEGGGSNRSEATLVPAAAAPVPAAAAPVPAAPAPVPAAPAPVPAAAAPVPAAPALVPATATLGPVAAALMGNRSSTSSFRVAEERSQATRADGVSLDLLVIDHIRGRVSCYPPDADQSAGRHIELPADDRVVNVPLPYLFRSLAMGEIDQLHFQLAFCRDGPILRNMIAVPGPRVTRDGRE